MVGQLTGANAYAQVMKTVQDAVSDGGSTAAGGVDKSAFASLIEDNVGNLADATSQAEATSAKALAGQADLVEVVTAVSNAEMVVETVVAVRDKVIKAYEEVIKMPV